MPSSVRDGTRQSASRIRLYSSAVILCWASNCGVMETGSGTAAEEAVVITITSIVARPPCERRTQWAGAFQELQVETSSPKLAFMGRRLRVLADRRSAVRYFGSRTHPSAGMAELADAADSKSADPCGHGGSTPPPGTMLKLFENHYLRNWQNVCAKFVPKTCQICANDCPTGITKSTTDPRNVDCSI